MMMSVKWVNDEEHDDDAEVKFIQTHDPLV